MSKNAMIFCFVALAVVIIGLVIVFWKKLHPAVAAVAQAAGNATGGVITGLPAKQNFVSGDQVDSTTSNLKFRSSPTVKPDNELGTFSSGVAVGSTDANGWVRVQKFSAQLEPEEGYVYSGYLKKIITGHGAGGTW